MSAASVACDGDKTASTWIRWFIYAVLTRSEAG